MLPRGDEVWLDLPNSSQPSPVPESSASETVSI